ncbi:MAG: glycerophosphodiester phosphodiesterase [Clostridium sp.]|nr:glycerophosphodiester phosphodiesterase [Clostridium sp.]MCM1173122.1 glycerophosphodiester phosphodiesterase [Clostridium sp.]MCM1208938.1 glycerophosphodiester phosphodiesterase [Ruminococcus sp.]
MKTAVIAHRGASGLAGHENTLEAFNAAIRLGCDCVEFDVRKTADGWLVVFHDSKIETVPIAELTYGRLCEMTAKHGYTVPLLKDVLTLCQGKIKLDIELKEAGYEKTVVDMVKSSFGYGDFVMKSFSDAAITHIKKYDRNIKTGLLVGRKHVPIKTFISDMFPMKRLKSCHADFVAAHYVLCSRLYVNYMHKHGLKVFVWTVNSPKAIKRCLWFHADAVITDRPDRAMKILYRLRHRKCSAVHKRREA